MGQFKSEAAYYTWIACLWPPARESIQMSQRVSVKYVDGEYSVYKYALETDWDEDWLMIQLVQGYVKIKLDYLQSFEILPSVNT